MELKIASNEKEFQENAKEYVINMTSRSQKLHIKNGCRFSKWLWNYYDFDSLADAKNCGVESTRCQLCFKGEK